MVCPGCQRDNPEHARFCADCGARLPGPCPRCGERLRPAARFCSMCGTRVSDAEPEYEARPAARLPESFAAGRYRVIRLLGEGARRWVCLARDEQHDRDVAIAVLKQGALDAENRLRMAREAEAMARVGGHPSIVTRYEAGTEEGETYQVYRYMAGGDLAARLRRTGLRRAPLRETLLLAHELLEALGHVHRHGVIHRDLRPGNVYFDAMGRAALGNFGLAHFRDGEATPDERTLIGTLAYMAPELTLGQPPTARSDLYTLGAILYEVLAGRPPFQADDAAAALAHHVSTPPPPLASLVPSIPPDLEDLTKQLLAKDPRDRPVSAARAQKRVRALLRDLDAPAGRAAPSPPGRARQRGHGVFVGREEEMTRLRAALDLALAGEMRALFIGGEPGIGKTRLAEEGASQAARLGALALWGHSHSLEDTPAYWPWIRIVRAHLETQDDAALREDLAGLAPQIAQIVPELRLRLPDTPPLPDQPHRQARFRLFDSVTRYLRRASERTPLLLILEDLHWADPASLLLLQFFVHEVGAARILLLGTFREEHLKPDAPLSDALAELSRRPAFERLTLHGIGRDDIGRFITLTSGVEPSYELVSAVHHHTEGNPFFMVEVVHHLIAHSGADRLRETRDTRIPIPQSVHDVLGQRFKQLSRSCHEVLSTASVVGRDFGVEILEPVCERSREALLADLEEAVDARLIQPVRDARGMFRFGHALIRDTLYEAIGPARQAPIHARVGAVLERRFNEGYEEHLPSLAYHFFQGLPGGTGAEKAFDYTLRAAGSAMQSLAYEEAVDHYQRAEKILSRYWPGSRERLCEVLLALAEALWKTTDMQRSRETFLRAAEHARALGDPEKLARAALGYGGVGYTGIWDTTGTVDRFYVELLEEALQGLERKDSPLRCRLLGRLGVALYWERSSGRHEALTREAVEMAERIGDPELRCYAMCTRHITTWAPENLDERLENSKRIVDLAFDTGIPEYAAQGYIWLVASLMEHGDMDAADAKLTEYIRLADELREPQYLWRATLLGTTRAFMMGDLELMETIMFRGDALAQHMTDANRMQAFGAQFAHLRREQGHPEEIVGAVDAALAQVPDVKNWQIAAGIVYHLAGRAEDARAAWNAFMANDFRDVPRDYLWLSTLSCAAELSAMLEDVPRARILYDLLSPYEERNILVGDAAAAMGPGAWYLGLLASTLGRREDAERHFRRAVEMCVRMKLPLFEARSRLTLAEHLLDQGGAGRAEEGARLLDEALEAGRRMGSGRVVEGAINRKLRLQGIDPATKTSIGLVAARVQTVRPELESHVSPDGQVTLLFSDMEGFSRMTERLGDEEAHKVVQAHNTIVRQQAQQHGGLEVEMQGDAFLLAFPSPLRAIRCAVGVQEALAEYNRDHPEQPIHIRMGLHAGEAIRDTDRFFGKTVIIAARIAALARADEILISEPLQAPVEQAGELRLLTPREVKLKGLSDTYTLYPVDWTRSSVARAASAAP